MELLKIMSLAYKPLIFHYVHHDTNPDFCDNIDNCWTKDVCRLLAPPCTTPPACWHWIYQPEMSLWSKEDFLLSGIKSLCCVRNFYVRSCIRKPPTPDFLSNNYSGNLHVRCVHFIRIPRPLSRNNGFGKLPLQYSRQDQFKQYRCLKAKHLSIDKTVTSKYVYTIHFNNNTANTPSRTYRLSKCTKSFSF